MIFEFFVNDDIHKKNNNIIDNNLEYFKCKFYINMKIWKKSNLFAVFTNDAGYIETVPLGEANELLTCIIPQTFLNYDKVFLYIYSDDYEHETNTIIVNLTNKSKNKNNKKCNVITDIYYNIDQKIDNIIYEDCQLKCYSQGTLIDAIYLHNIDNPSSLYLKEDVANKTVEISNESTDDEYPSAKATYDYINSIIGQIEDDMLS